MGDQHSSEEEAKLPRGSKIKSIPDASPGEIPIPKFPRKAKPKSKPPSHEEEE